MKTRRILRRRLAWAVVGLLVLAGLGLGFHQRHVFHCYGLGWHEGPLGRGILTECAEDSGRLAQQRNLLATSQQAVEASLGPLRSTPRVVFAERPETLRRFTGSTRVVSVTMLVPGTAVVVLGPAGQQVIYLTHERVHAELHARLGYRRVMGAVPAWFQEGLAMAISQDDRYPESAWRLRQQALGWTLADLADYGRFNRRAAQDGLVAYGMAQAAVVRWLGQAGPSGLQQLLRDVEGGEPFQSAFRRLGPAA